MSRTFTKLFSSITESTVWCEPDRTRLVWICMLAMSDRNGRVWGSVPGIANRARVPIEDARIAIATFLAPDPDSRTPDNEGRRIETIDGGWRLLNHEKYRAIRDEESSKEAKRNYINARRAKERDLHQSTLSTVDRCIDNAEADTEADAEKTKIQQPTVAAANGVKKPRVTDHDEIIFGYGVPILVNAGNTDKHARAFLGGLRKQHGDDALIEKLRECLKAKPLQPLEWLGAALPPKPRPGKQGALEARNAAVAQKIKDSLNAID